MKKFPREVLLMLLPIGGVLVFGWWRQRNPPPDENTLDAPRKVAPQPFVLPVNGALTHTFPANSVTVLRVK